MSVTLRRRSGSAADGLDRRLTALREAADLARGRARDETVEVADAVVARAGARLGLGVEATVVALAGPTGAGKSTLFNALVGEEVVTSGRRRPTTSTATAALWGTPPDALLDWLEVPRRHRVADEDRPPLVLLDLPDFDSVERANRDEVERVIALADLLVWVVDPQKYADAAWHERYLQRLTSHGAVMEVVLNQVDTLGDEGARRMGEDLARLLRADGLDDVPVHLVSAATGQGLEDLRTAIERRAAARSAAVERLAADVQAAAGALGSDCGAGGRARGVQKADRQRLVAALGEACGVPAVVRAVDRAPRSRGALATGWPLMRWLRRLRPDPLRRLRLEAPAADAPAARPSIPAPTAVQRAGVTTATRALADSASDGLPHPWPQTVRDAATRDEDRAVEELTASLGEVDLGMSAPRWWTVAGALQRALLAVTLIGVVWLLALAALGWLRVEDFVPTPDVEGIALPTLLAVGGTLASLLVAFLARLLTGAGARRRARAAQRRLDARVAAVGEARVIAPVTAELEAREQLAAAVAAAQS